MRVLIAEDDRACRSMYEFVLRRQGHEVFVADDGEEAVQMAQCHQPDVILMDILMPRMDGFAALEQLKADERTAGIPVLLMSAGCITEADFERGLRLGAACYLAKPFSVLDLPERLESYAKKKVRDGPGLRNPDLNRERSF